MQKLIILILIGFSFIDVFSQSIDNKSKFEKYDKLTYTAKIHSVDKDYKNELYYLKEALKIIPDDLPDVYFSAATAALHLEDYEEAKRLIIESIKQTNASKDYFLRFSEFDPFRSNKIFAEIEKDYPIYQDYFFKHLEHPEIYHELDQMLKGDQDIRKTGGGYSDVDTANIDRLIEITKQYGWQEKGWLILWHQRGTYGEDNYVWNFFKPYIDDQITKGNIRKNFWAMFDEQAHMMKTQTQIYGLYWSQLDEYPIIDIENVDKRLKEAGLPPLWYMRKVLGVKLPEEYKGTPETSGL